MLEIHINGKPYSTDDLTFREQREVRATVRELVGDPTVDLEDVALMDFVPALVYVVTKRDRPDFTLEDALDVEFADAVKDAEEAPPTRAAAKPKRTP